MILETILASPHSIRSFVPSLVKPLMKRSDFWASQIPPMLFPLPRLNDAIEEVRDFILKFPFNSFMFIYFPDFRLHKRPALLN